MPMLSQMMFACSRKVNDDDRVERPFQKRLIMAVFRGHRKTAIVPTTATVPLTQKEARHFFVALTLVVV